MHAAYMVCGTRVVGYQVQQHVALLVVTRSNTVTA
jgi:hypothetical protein